MRRKTGSPPPASCRIIATLRSRRQYRHGRRTGTNAYLRQPIYVIFEGHHSCRKSKLSDAIRPSAADNKNPH
jgi:hypothetical protein